MRTLPTASFTMRRSFVWFEPLEELGGPTARRFGVHHVPIPAPSGGIVNPVTLAIDDSAEQMAPRIEWTAERAAAPVGRAVWLASPLLPAGLDLALYAIFFLGTASVLFWTQFTTPNVQILARTVAIICFVWALSSPLAQPAARPIYSDPFQRLWAMRPSPLQPKKLTFTNVASGSPTRVRDAWTVSVGSKREGKFHLYLLLKRLKILDAIGHGPHVS